MTEGQKNFWRVQGVFYKKPVGFTITSREMVASGHSKVDVSNYAGEMVCLDKQEIVSAGGMGKRPIEYTVVALPSPELCESGGCSASHHCILRLIAKDPGNSRFLEIA